MSFAADEETLAGSRRSSSPDLDKVDLNQYTLAKRPWRRHATPFEAIAKHQYPGKGTADEPYIISWIDADSQNENPQSVGSQYKSHYKWAVTALVAVATLAVALASSAYSGAVDSIRAEFGASQEVIVLGVSLFVLGFAIGPLLWAPAGEVFGRRNCFIFSYSFFTLWNAVTCSSQSMAQILVFRFLAGAFGSSPLVNAGGTIADIFPAKQRGLGLAIFAAAPFLGPALGPIAGGFLGETAGWRWVEGLLAAFSGTLLILGVLFLPETYAPTLLRSRAKLLSKVTGKYYRASMDAKKELVIGDLIKTSLTRPWVLLFSEPIVMILSIYVAIIYGVLYMLFSAYPIVFQQGHGFSPGVGGLAFIPVAIGILIGIAYIIFYDNPRYIRVVESHEGKAPPEARLPPAIVGSVSLVIGLAWFSAACSPSTHWIVPMIAGAPFGLGMVLVFVALQNYLWADFLGAGLRLLTRSHRVDAYVIYAASVLAANSLLRSLFGAAFPLFTTQMYNGLGLQWAASIPAFLALLCMPFPYLFYMHGAKVRYNCKFAREAAETLEKMQAQNSNEKSEKPKESA